METSGSIALWQRLERIEQTLCLRVNRGCRYPSIKALFSVASRLGDGGVWYLLMLVLAVNGENTLLVGASRIMLGLHDPSDVIAGAVIGATLAWASLAVWPA